MVVETHRGLRLEITSRRMSGPLVPGGRPNTRLYGGLLGTAIVLMLGLLVVPTVWTGVLAFSEDGRPSLGHFASVFTDPESRRAFLHTGAWLLIAAALVLIGFVLAVVSQHFRRWSAAFERVMILPFGLSALASGAAFRIIFDPNPERGTASALMTGITGSSPVWLGPDLIWWVLISAFAWTWLGFAVSLYRAGLGAIPPEHLRRARMERSSVGFRGLSQQVRLLWPVTAVVGLPLFVAAARMFDLVLIVAPGPMQDEADVVSVHWWRLSTSTADPGQPAAVAVVLLAGVALVALLGRNWMHQPHRARRSPPRDVRPREGRTPWLNAGIGLVVSLLWAFPMVVLMVTAVRSPDDSGAVGWWRPASAFVSFASLHEVWDAGLPDALWSTFLIAIGSAVTVTGLAIAPAQALASTALHRRLLTALIVLLSVLAVLPVQMYVGPLRQLFVHLGLTGSGVPLVLMHAAAGLPFGILVLRGALASARESRVADALVGQTGYRTAARRIWNTTGQALVAVAVVEFVLVWDDFIVSFLVSGPGTSPLTLVLWGEARQFGTSAGPVAAAAIVSALVPACLLLLTWRRWVVPGLTGGVFR